MLGALRKQRFDELIGLRHLSDQRMRHQGLVDELPVSRYGSRDGESLVGRHVLREAEELWRERRLRQRHRAVRRDSRRNLDDVVVSESDQRAVVPRVDDLGVAVSGRQRRNELRRGFAVIRASALLEQRGLRDECLVAIEVEQLSLDPGDRRRPRHARSLLVEHLVVEVEVAQVVRGDRAQLLENARGWPE